ncbi:hypothetical protein GUY61_35525, partial [Streptomyces sp. GC420]|nr:hypothetical protein [Streptomyces sp. GC420]
MSRWALGRRGGSRRRVSPDSGYGARAVGRDDRAGTQQALAVEEYGGVLLLREVSDDTLSRADVDDLAGSLAAEDEHTVTVVAGPAEAPADALWARLGTLLDDLCEEGVTTVRLAMSGTGHDGRDRPAVARRIADAWGLSVIAPDSAVLVVPGGGLFVLPRRDAGSASGEGWWRFGPGAKPVPLGPRQPAPSWERDRPGALPSPTRGGCVVERIPAGLLIRPREARAPRPGDLCYAVPVDQQGPTVLVGVPDGEDVLPADVEEAVSALSDTARSRVRIAPGGRRDVLGTGQALADALGSEVVVHTGLPLLAASGPADRTVRATLADAGGTPRWHPYVDAVACLPREEPDGPPPSPRLVRWSPPIPGRGSPRAGEVQLSDRWRVAVTRAGIWVCGRDGLRPEPAARPVSADGPVIEVGRPGEPLDVSLWPELSRLLAGLGRDVCARARLHVHGVCVDGGREARRLAGLHSVRSIRFGAGVTAPAAGSRAAGAVPGPGPASGAPAERRPSAAAPGPASRPERPGPPLAAAATTPGPGTGAPAAARASAAVPHGAATASAGARPPGSETGKPSTNGAGRTTGSVPAAVPTEATTTSTPAT